MSITGRSKASAQRNSFFVLLCEDPAR